MNGILPDINNTGLKNALKINLEKTLSDALAKDINSIINGYDSSGIVDWFTHPAEPKVKGVEEFVFIIDDYEKLQLIMENFLLQYLVPSLSSSKFKTYLIIIGRDDLSDTKEVWDVSFKNNIIGKIKLEPFNDIEAKSFIKKSGINDETIISRIIKETSNYPFLLENQVEEELGGDRSAFSLKKFFDRTTRWMTPIQKKWVKIMAFFDAINLEIIENIFPEEDAEEVLEWFKKESSIRSTDSRLWTIKPLIRSKVCEYVQVDSPRLYSEYQGLVEKYKLKT